MKFTFQTFCIAVVVTTLHLVVLAAASALFDFPESNSANVTKIDFASIAEEFLEKPETDDSMNEAGVEDEVPPHPLAANEEEEKLHENKQATRTETSAIIDTRDLTGRVDPPTVSDYVKVDSPLPAPPLPPTEVTHTEDTAATNDSQPVGPHSIRTITPRT